MLNNNTFTMHEYHLGDSMMISVKPFCGQDGMFEMSLISRDVDLHLYVSRAKLEEILKKAESIIRT